MATVTLHGNPIDTIGELPSVNSSAPSFTLTLTDLSDLTLDSLKGSKVVLNIFPSIDTETCAVSVRTFNQKAAGLDNVKVVCVAADLPFALARFCGAEGLDNVVSASSFRSTFGDDYGVTFTSLPLKGLLSRAIVVIDEQGQITHTEQVAETGDEPNYAAALAAL